MPEDTTTGGERRPPTPITEADCTVRYSIVVKARLYEPEELGREIESNAPDVQALRYTLEATKYAQILSALSTVVYIAGGSDSRLSERINSADLNLTLEALGQLGMEFSDHIYGCVSELHSLYVDKGVRDER